ncbi:hypothetical protein L6R53_02410 [Myxococcota bacterium]|nr:hypothetical protein [Myxococcota bacterium]
MALVPLLALVGCVDYGLVSPDQPQPDVTELPTQPDPDGGPPERLRECPAPDVLAPVSVNEACLAVVQEGELDATVEWSTQQFEEEPNYDQVVMAPVVGHLDDDDGDGTLGPGDVPDVVVVTDDAGREPGKGGVLRILDGRDGRVQRSIVSATDGVGVFLPYRYGNVALGDVDADGRPELVLLVLATDGGGGGSGTTEPIEDTGGAVEIPDTGSPIMLPPPLPSPLPSPMAPLPDTADPAGADLMCRVVALEPDGSLTWVNAATAVDCAGHAPALADLDADGHPEVVIGNLVLNGEDGTVAWQGQGDQGRFYAYAEMGTHPVVSDLDGDGRQEVIAGRTVYSSDGSVRCTAGGDHDGFTAVADLDGDGQGEFVLVGAGQVQTFDTDCAPMHAWPLAGGGNGGPPTIGDLDQDGRPEIGLCAAELYSAYEVDGTLIWSQPVSDFSSHATGSLIFDFESDGRPELVYADEMTLWVFDGPTGGVRLRDTRHASRTLHDYPTVADIDGDGSVEIIVPNGGGHYDRTRVGVYALGSLTSTWQAGRQVWNQHAYSVTNIHDDLTIPSPPEPNWPLHNSFRSGDPNPQSAGLWPDVVPVAELCHAECAAGRLVLDVALANQGAAALRAGVPVTAWYEDDGARVYLGVSWTGQRTEAGAMSPVARFEVDAAALAGRPVYVMADQDDHGADFAEECEESNNLLTLVDTSCE